MNRFLWISGSAAFVAAATALWLSNAGAASGDLIALMSNAPVTLNAAGKTQLGSLAASVFPNVTANKLDEFSCAASTEADDQGQQIRQVVFSAVDADCGTPGQARSRKLLGSGFTQTADVNGDKCWELRFSAKTTDPATLALVDSFASMRLAHSDPATLGYIRCKRNRVITTQIDCWKFDVQTLTAAQEFGPEASRIVREIGRVP
jgi:hypothetical protein